MSRFRDFDLETRSWQAGDSQMRIGSIPYLDNQKFEQLRSDNSLRVDKWWVASPPAAFLRDIREYGFWLCDEPAGVVTLWDIDYESKTAYVSYWIDEKWENTGYTTRMVQVLFDHLSQVGEFSTLYAIIQPTNVPSLRVAEKCQMYVTGSATYPMVDGSMAEHLIYKKDL